MLRTDAQVTQMMDCRSPDASQCFNMPHAARWANGREAAWNVDASGRYITKSGTRGCANLPGASMGNWSNLMQGPLPYVDGLCPVAFDPEQKTGGLRCKRYSNTAICDNLITNSPGNGTCWPGGGEPGAASFNASNAACWRDEWQKHCPQPQPANKSDVFDSCTPGDGRTCCAGLQCIAESPSYAQCCIAPNIPAGCGVKTNVSSSSSSLPGGHSPSSPPGTYERYPGANSYTGHGAGREIDTGDVGVGPLSVAGCEARCDADPECDCVTFEPEHQRCWKRGHCDPTEFDKQFGDTYDTYVRLEKEYVGHSGRNCYAGHGGDDIDGPDGVYPFTAAACEARCDADEKCSCITYRKEDQHCWKRASCQIDQCVSDDVYDTYVRQPPPPPPPSPTPPSPTPTPPSPTPSPPSPTPTPPAPQPPQCGVQDVTAGPAYKRSTLGQTTTASFDTCKVVNSEGYNDPGSCNQPPTPRLTCSGQLSMQQVTYPAYGVAQWECHRKNGDSGLR